ncbi:conserved hypothetical protein [Verticillium alfalfae VaMs.102]|uniref:Uncharacterized protein n=1 Tax=Verticillium alfalfae (strain VaMs.102 / ATCC MYA-4576 / FGSC 10136) TaxID=526221 RepID=C9SJ62_VERA1|nr:conserved hypothetical protein [Verticillium alfalfae VaMs.102]EEY18224.1 conserved hypothetical protein [Verticillium alfalfae VaMs.102]
MGVQQPFLYEAMGSRGSSLPEKSFDPKAVTRASYTPKAPKPKKHDGPLISFNRHPDAHMVLSHRSTTYLALSPRMKGWIKGLRVFQLILRVFQFIGAAGLLTLLVLLTGIPVVVGWVLRIAPGVVSLHCAYAIYHLSRPASSRTPASSAAYQIFAAVSDICIVPGYVFGALSVRNHGSSWTTRLSDASLVDYFVPAVGYTFLGAGALHLVSLSISVWLGLVFRRIASMPPDLNPLEDRFTSRAKHTRNKSSIATTSTTESERRLSTPLEDRRRSGLPYEDISRPPTIPFLRTRADSGSSSSNRNSIADFPSRQYQIVPSNSSPRNSFISTDTRRLSKPPSMHQGYYSQVPLEESETARSLTNVDLNAPASPHAGQQRVAKFTETWSASDSLISRTQHRNQLMNAAARNRESYQKTYDALDKRYDVPDGDDSDSEHGDNYRVGHQSGDGDVGSLHPQPLRSNPPAPWNRLVAPYNSLHGSASPERKSYPRSFSGSHDIADEKHALNTAPVPPPHRTGSIQRESDFFAKPYGQLKPATPPIIIGSNRQVSSGNDYDGQPVGAFSRRNVSGKIAEEGRATLPPSHSRFSILNK